ncbi:MAG TPA: Mov34/MPN/PAD-1 family protein [Anaerolineales bacterium]|nr:Mov34/MPN/PAD-1 family protein [Anaerolineales bacterium]
MGDAPRIRLLPDDTPAPAPARFPSGQARRWRSAFDSEVDEAAVEVFVTPRAYVRVCAHAGSDLYHEVGGALVGVRRLDPKRGTAFVVVEAVVPAQHTRHGPSYLTFTQDSLVAIHDDLDRRYPGREFVGWYHTHPGMGVFLSGYDVWLHEHFFQAAWQVALVVEPRLGEGGFFVRGRDGTLDPRAYRGFYELLRKGRESVMRWTNLSADGDAPAELEEPAAEAGGMTAGGG